ncbi:MAG TPA: homogentisate 1,2-dioxygenase [Dongiaceae bacterium]|jgi:homogentisate 1,2-dioxygenase|nr:homogentisate 1,2-dioxygenase [Dongiaceae bacterium]
MKQWIKIPHIEGQASRQAHADLPPDTYERELGKEGFFGPATHMYHKHPPTGWSEWQGPLRPRAFELTRLASAGSHPSAARDILHNAHMRLRFWRCSEAMDSLMRNADGDELLFVHEGAGEFYCDYGHMSYRQGDYIVMPRATMWRIEPEIPTSLLMVEATSGSYRLPDRGLVGPHAIFDPAILDVPAVDEVFQRQQGDNRTWQVVVKRRGELSTITYPFNPLDAVGWHGDLHPVRLNVKDIRPLMSHRYHLPPSAHTTFVADRFVVCTFVPRPFETDPGAIKVPFFHSNDDFDEVIFYHAGDFFSRDHIKPGMMTLHPCGHTHGPHPKALKNILTQSKPGTDEYAVMIDARDGLDVGEAATAVENPDYVNSWKNS